MSLINVSELTFAYEGSFDNIFENVSFQLDTDWKLGFTGRNGRGKTTFLKLLTGEYEYSGSISASVEFEYFPYEVRDPDADALEAARSVCPELELWRLRRELGELCVDEGALYRPFSTLSKGEQTKVLLAVMFLKDNRFLLIDEPTNHLDMRGREQVSRYLNSKKGFILVSHDRAFLDGCVDHVLSINRTGIEIQKGDFSSWYRNKELRDAFELDRNARLRKDIKRLEAAARQSRQWADKVESEKIGNIKDREKYNECGGRAYIGEQSRRMQQRRKNLERRQNRALEEKETLLKDVEVSDALKIRQSEYRSRRLVTLDGVSVSYGGGAVCSGVSFVIEKGDRVALLGGNGSGKSSLIRLIVGQDIPHTGEVTVGGGLKISYVPQDASGLRGDLSDYAESCGIDESLFKAILRKLDFGRVQFEKDMADFSAGQKKKVLIARSLCEDAHLHIWDEPLNYVDVISRIQIEELLLKYAPTILFVEHDKAFCDRVATKTVEL